MDSLFYQFLDIVEAFSSQEQVFDMINSFVNGCGDALEITGNLRKNEKMWLEAEKNTWRLIYALYENRQHFSCDDLDLHIENDLDIMKNFFQNNNSIRECQIVVDWLEECASGRSDCNERPKLSHFMDKTIAWENTLHQIQVKNVAYASARPLVTAMDADAPHREKRQLHDLDMEDETRLLDQVFFEIRCGRLYKAVEICNLCGHKWRAAILQGWMLYNDPNYGSTDTEHVISAFGNPHRDIWKNCAWQLIEKSNCSSTWKAIIGVLCGNLSALLPACSDWEDLLWAYLKVYIDVKVEEEIRSMSMKSNISLPDQYWDFKFNVDEIFEEIAGYTDTSVRVEASKPERIIQRLVITDKIPNLICTLANWCTNENTNHHLIRMAAHIVICLRVIGIQYNNEKIEDVLRRYVEVLMKIGDAKLVAYYTAMLSEDNQIKYYSEFLESISDEEERIKSLEAAESCHLPLEAITKRVVQMIRNKSQEVNDSVNLASGLSKEDEQKISSLDLIMHYAHQRDEALWETNALIRYFLLQRNLQAANYAFDKIPENSIEIILKKLEINETLLQTKPEIVPDRIFATIREYFCYKVYLNAELKFADWFHCFHKMEPLRPQKPHEDAQFTHKVTYEHQLNQYKTEYAKWKASLEEITKIVKTHLYNMLLFPDGGWLAENRYFEDSSRIHQMNSLRRLCIPKIAVLLQTILQNMEMYDECLKLADIITSENYQIYKAYSTQDLAEILRKICESSVCFLKQGRDPFGLQVSS